MVCSADYSKKKMATNNMFINRTKLSTLTKKWQKNISENATSDKYQIFNTKFLSKWIEQKTTWTNEYEKSGKKNHGGLTICQCECAKLILFYHCTTYSN